MSIKAQLHSNLTKDLTKGRIGVFISPIPSLHPASQQKERKIHARLKLN